MDYYDNYHKYQKYKQKYLLGGDTLQEAYLKSIEEGECRRKYTPTRDAIEDIYRILEDDELFDRKLFLKKFPGSCGKYWNLISVDQLASLSLTASESLDYYIRRNEILVYQHRFIPKLICCLVNDRNDILRLYYGENRENIIIKLRNRNLNHLPKSDRIFKIDTRYPESSRIKECHIGIFYYDANPTPDMEGNYPSIHLNLKDQINNYIRKTNYSLRNKKKKRHKWRHWTTYLLASIVNLLINCLHCQLIHLDDSSTLNERNCEPHTVIYNKFKNNINGMYQTIGFRADPPINFKTLSDIGKLPYHPDDPYQHKMDRPARHYQQFIDKEGRYFYYHPSSNYTYSKPTYPDTIEEMSLTNEEREIQRVKGR